MAMTMMIVRFWWLMVTSYMTMMRMRMRILGFWWFNCHFVCNDDEDEVIGVLVVSQKVGHELQFAGATGFEPF